MVQRWSKRVTGPVRTFIRRGALLLLVPLLAGTLILSPVATRQTNAQGLTDLLSLTSFTSGLSSCAVETVGWVVCPTMRSIAKLADYGFSYINGNFLRVDYGISSTSSGTYKTWEIMRNIANALFVIAFMVLIYSQLTGRSGGYSIKRLLPRLIIAAIAVNVSYYICAIFIDVSNIVGDSILRLLGNISGKTIMPIVGATANSGSIGDVSTLTDITSAVLGKTGTVWVLLAPVAAVTISIATICAAAITLLIMRKTVIAMLILASPILFVAFLLPNLEKYFMQSVRLFAQLLLLYPIIALLLGAGQIVCATITSTGSSASDANYKVSQDGYMSKNGGSGSAITDLTAAGAAVVPLLGVWFIFKNMSSIMSTAGSRLSATVAGRRRSDDDKNARVTGKATEGAANAKNPSGLGNFNRRQAFSRNRRRASLGGSALTDEDAGASTRGALAGQAGAAAAAAQNAMNAKAGNDGVDEDAKKRFEELQNAQINGDAEGLDVNNAVAAAVAGNKEQEKEKQKTAKDIFNNMNRSHESKDKDRKFNSGPAPAGSGGGGGGGSTQPAAPASNYHAPAMAQSGNIVTGSAPQSQQPTRIIAVPVQVDASALLNNQQHQQTPGAPGGIPHTPTSGIEEKAKARAQKYLFKADQDIKDASDKLDVLGRGTPQAPDEPPHTQTSQNKEDKR